jgi:putative chitinase
MIEVDQPKFFVAYTARFGNITEEQQNALMFLLNSVAQDADHWPSIQQFAYGLATFKWETAHTFKPVFERGPKSYFDKYEPGTKLGKDLGNTLPGDGYLFRGRGYIQLTGRANYAHAGQQLKIDLVSKPDAALDASTAYKIASAGMRDGWFTGKKLDQCIPAGGTPDYVNARRIINGLDNAQKIADIATDMEHVLAASVRGFSAAA